jgi:chemotaxis protein CheX
MNVRFLNPFVEAAFEVLKAETGVTATRGDLALEKAAFVTEDVTVILALVGAVEGSVFYCMDQQTAMGLVSHMIGEPVHSLDSLAQSGIAELGNVITGRASVKLSEAGFEANISPPSLLLGKGAMISTLDSPRLIVPVLTDCGKVIIHLSLREGINHNLKAAEIAVPVRPKI